MATVVQTAESVDRSDLDAVFASGCTTGNVILVCIVGMGVSPTLDPNDQAGGYVAAGWTFMGSLEGDAASHQGTLHARIYGKTAIGGETAVHRKHDSSGQTMTILEISGITLAEFSDSLVAGPIDVGNPSTMDLGDFVDADGWAIQLTTWGRDHGAPTAYTVTPGSGWTEISDRGEPYIITAGWMHVQVRNIAGPATVACSIDVTETGGAGIGSWGGVALLFGEALSEPEPTPGIAWDIYAADDLQGPIIATLEHATERSVRVEEDGTGFGAFAINRHASEATAAILAKGNLVRVRFPEISEDYIAAFFLEQGDFTLLSPSEQGGEVLRFGGRGALAYLDRARMWHESFTTDPTVTDVWEQVWRTGAIRDPVGSAVVGGDATYVYVISATTRKIYKIRQSDRAIVRSSPPLWTGADNYAGGLGADPSDSTILWVLEAPWSLGGAGNTKIRKVRISDWAILDTHNLGSATKLTEVKADSSNLWTSRYENTNTIQKRSKADGSVVTNYDISYGGVTQVLATGISVNGTQLAYWYAGKKRALIASSSAPTTITDKITTTGLSAFGGDWTTEGGLDYFYPVSYTADVVWKYQLTTSTPTDPVGGEWRLDELTPGAILWRIIAEAQAGARPVQPIPDLTHVFDSTDDSTSDPWDSHAGTAEFTASVGDLVLETVLRLIPFGLTLQMSPLLVLEGYNAANFGTDRSSASFAAGKVRLLGGTNIAEETQRRLDDRRVDSIMLAQGEGNTYATAVDDDLGYQREGFLPTSLTSASALEGSAEAELEREREVSEAIRLVLTWGDDEAVGLYLPGPAGSNGHYWVGDTVRVHTGAGEFDIDEQDLAVKAISITELPNGDWESVVELLSAFLPTEVPTSSGSGSSDIGGSGGAGAGTTTKVAVTVKDSLTGDSYVGSQVESDDWGVFQPGQGRVGVSVRAKKLRELLDAELDAIKDGEGIAWDATLEAWLPVYLGDPRHVVLGYPDLGGGEEGEDGPPGPPGRIGVDGAAGAPGAGLDSFDLNYIIDGGAATLTTGIRQVVRLPFDCTVTEARAYADQNGSIDIDILRATHSNYDTPSTHPVAGDSIIGAGTNIVISSADKYEDTSLDWDDVTLQAGDLIAPQIVSVTTIRKITVVLTLVPA